MNIQPPKRALKFLRWFCREDYLEEIEGDLIEIFENQYEQSPRKAKRQFAWRVVKAFQPAFIKSFQRFNNSNTTAMLKNNLKISWRSLKRQPFFTFLNTFGLAIGMAGALLISLFIYDELSFDRMFPGAERIYRVNIDNRIGGETNKYASVSAPLANVMRKDYPQAELITQFRDVGSVLLREVEADRNVKESNVIGVDDTFFEMFGLDLIVGDPNTAFNEGHSLVMTRTAAEKHFEVNKALGQSIKLNNDEVFVVTGVMEDLPKNSFLRDHSVFISLSSFQDATSPAWNNWNYPTFVKLRSDANVDHFQSYLSDVKERYLIPWAMSFVPGLTIESSREQDKVTGNFMIFDGIALTDIHLYSPNLSGEFSSNNDIQNVYILSFIGLFLITLACVNFMNLSTAYSLKRAKEVGIRKTLGSRRVTLIYQFLTEAGLLSFLSLLIAIGLASLILPFFNSLADKAIVIPFGNLIFWTILLGATTFLALLSGSYPAFVLSSFMPLKVLKGQSESSVGGGRMRNVLVIVQFTISIFLIVSTLVVFQQLNFIQNKDLGYNKDQILIIEDVDAAGDQIDAFKQEVERIGKAERASLSSYLPTPSERFGVTFFPEGFLMQAEKAIIIEKWGVDYDYIPVLGLEIIAGRGFDKQFSTDNRAIILNESAVTMMGMTPEDIIGLRITDDIRKEDEKDMLNQTVIGVVKNFHFETLRNSIDAMSLTIGGSSNKMMIKLKPGEFSSTIAKIENNWNELTSGQPFDYYFMDDSFNQTYLSEQKLGKIFMIFTALSLFIACLGLFGLAAFNAEKRAKEIGIRKVLGASISQITVKLSRDFLKLVGIAILLSLPIAWYAMNRWLEDFSYRIEISEWTLALAAVLALFISILTVSHQSIKAALSNPVKSLRSE